MSRSVSSFRRTRTSIRRGWLHWALLVFGVMWLVVPQATAMTLRIAEYNTDCYDQGNDDNITGAGGVTAGIPAIVQAMGQHHIGTNAQPVDVLALTECLTPGTGGISQTLIDLTSALNTIYGAGCYSYANYTDPTTGSGPNGLIYNTHTVTVIGGLSLGYSGTPGNTTSIQRAPMRYELQPVNYGPNADFYVYVSHYHSGSASSDESIRQSEAAEIRADADALGASAHVIYSGDYNWDDASTETSYSALLSAGNGRAYDPVSFPNASSWTNSSPAYQDLYSELSSDSATGPLVHRYDAELVSGAMIGSTAQPGLQLVADNSDPYDPQDFPSKQYKYAYEIFGNNGTIPEGDTYNVAGNTALSDLSDAKTILNDLEPPSGSDHLPVVADYTIVGIPEPSALTLLATLFIPLASRHRKRRD